MKYRLYTLVRKLVYDLKLKYKMIYAYSVLIVISIVLLGLTSYYLMQKYLVDSETKALEQSMVQLNNSIDYFFESYLNASAMVFSNNELQEMLTRDIDGLLEAIEIRQMVSSIASQIKNSFSFPEIKHYYYSEGSVEIRIFAKNDKLTEYGGDILPFADIQDEQWVKELYASRNSFVWQDNVQISGIPYITLNRKLLHFESLEDIGVMRIYIPQNKVSRIIQENMQDEKYKFLYINGQRQPIVNTAMTPDGESLLSEMEKVYLEEGTNRVAANSSGYIIGAIQSQVTGWSLVYATPIDTIEAKTKQVFRLTLYVIVFAIVLVVLISILISSYMTRRIQILVRKTNEVNENNLNAQVRIVGNDEIGQLDRTFNNMLLRIKHLIDSEYKSQLVANQTRLDLLQDQINPHLLYNTLSMISLIAERTKQQEILDVSNNLIGFYRGILNKGKTISSIREEVAMVERYIEIMKFVHRLDIECYMEIEEQTLELYTIKLLLQPIVENAIVHGLKPKKGGMLFISASERDNRVEIVISDDGVGMEEQMTRYLRSNLQRGVTENNYGLSNIMKRIQLFFGSNYGIDIESSKDSGTTVTVRLPKLKESEIKSVLRGSNLI